MLCTRLNGDGCTVCPQTSAWLDDQGHADQMWNADAVTFGVPISPERECFGTKTAMLGRYGSKPSTKIGSSTASTAPMSQAGLATLRRAEPTASMTTA